MELKNVICKERLPISSFNKGKNGKSIGRVCIKCEIVPSTLLHKVCTLCLVDKNIDNFYYNKIRKIFETRCNDCAKKHRQLHYIENKEIISSKNKIRYIKNKDIIIKRVVNYTFKMRKTPIGKVRSAIRNGIRRIFNSTKTIKSAEQYSLGFKYLGCTAQELKKYIESLWLNGMTWKNYGFYGWHIDHKIPVASVKSINDLDQIKKVCHYTNLQPLWAKDNLKKGVG